MKGNESNLNEGRYHFDRNPINGSVVLQKTVTNLNRRIFSLQNILQAKSHEILKLRDQKAEFIQNDDTIPKISKRSNKIQNHFNAKRR